jgi:hypothetical protein
VDFYGLCDATDGSIVAARIIPLAMARASKGSCLARVIVGLIQIAKSKRRKEIPRGAEKERITTPQRTTNSR